MIKRIFKSLLLVIFIQVICAEKSSGKSEDVWKQDLSDAFQINPSTHGLEKVHLRCGSNAMVVELETEKEFTGVMYTRGSFYKQSEPCFAKPQPGRNAKKLTLKFPLDQCQTVKDGELYSNVVIVQHEPDLVMPGDAAFAVECDFRKSRDLTVNAEMQTKDSELVASGSRISLTSPDPSYKHDRDSVADTVFNQSHQVTFVPNQIISDDATDEKKVRGTVESVKLEL
ncbi:uncharacterized protein LOC129799241 [Phlebotomus papatasi]|nr:uncharacterized protein LOC129799241 [Phlebotomus papatasi]